MSERGTMLCLASSFNMRSIDLSPEEQHIVSRLHYQLSRRNAYIVPALKPGPGPPDFVDDLLASDLWRKLSAGMGEADYATMWSKVFLFYELPLDSYLSLNGRLSLPEAPTLRRPTRRESVHPDSYPQLGYNPYVLIHREMATRQTGTANFTLLPLDYQEILTAILNEEVGVSCRQLDTKISSSQLSHLKKFAKKRFSIKHFKKRLRSVPAKMIPVSHQLVKTFLSNVLENYVPKGMIGSKRAFDRMKSNICQCVALKSRTPLRLGTLMKGLPKDSYPKNVFFTKLVVFLLKTFCFRLISSIFFLVESLKTKELLFFKKDAWKQYRRNSLNKLVSTGVLAGAELTILDPRVSRLSILHKTNGFRPLVRPSLHQKGRRNLLSACNTLLKQVVSQINPAYGRVLNNIHQQWIHLHRGTKEKFYVVRTDLKDAFLSVDHTKLEEVVTRRFSTLDAQQVSRTFHYSLQKRDKSVLHFTTVPTRFYRKEVFLEPGKKVYPLAQLQSTILRYIKNTFVVANGSIFHHAKGLPQGCMLSPVLCELYLTDMDDRYFKQLKGENDLLIRAVDDYLFVTRDRGRVHRFLELVERGVPEYGVTFQSAKTLSNCNSLIDRFPFFGYIFTPSCKKIEPDFSEWTDLAARTYLKPEMTWEVLKNRMVLLTYLKLHLLVFDSSYLHKFAVMKNIYSCAEIHARKYTAIYFYLEENCREPRTRAMELTPIFKSVKFIARKVVSHSQVPGSLTRHEAELIVLKGFLSVLGESKTFSGIVAELNTVASKLITRSPLSSRFKKLLKSLVRKK